MMAMLALRAILLTALVIATGVAPGYAQSGGPTIAGCPTLPADNIWNVRVDSVSVDPRSSDYVNSIGPNTGLHPDFGSGTWNGGPIGIPYTTVPGTQSKVPVTFQYASESDPGPYPIPPNPPIEGGPNSSGDRHILIVDRDNCRLYELYAAYPNGDGTWRAGSGAIFDLHAHALRPAGWTSADAAGLPILPGLVRWDEIASGEIRHALRFTAPVTQRKYVWPGRHYASSNTSPTVPPMGQRFRLKASFDMSPFPPTVQVILTALKRYGMMLADNGSAWFISGAPDPNFDDDELVTWLKQVRGSDFEAVDVSSLMVDPNSAASAAELHPHRDGQGAGTRDEHAGGDRLLHGGVRHELPERHRGHAHPERRDAPLLERRLLGERRLRRLHDRQQVGHRDLPEKIDPRRGPLRPPPKRRGETWGRPAAAAATAVGMGPRATGERRRSAMVSGSMVTAQKRPTPTIVGRHPRVAVKCWRIGGHTVPAR